MNFNHRIAAMTAAVVLSGCQHSTSTPKDIPQASSSGTSSSVAAPAASPPGDGVRTPCTTATLSLAVGSMSQQLGTAIGGITMTNMSSSSCTVAAAPHVQMKDANGGILDTYQYPVNWKALIIAPRESATIQLTWDNWCGGKPAEPVSLLFILRKGQILDATIHGLSIPSCSIPDEQSHLTMSE